MYNKKALKVQSNKYSKKNPYSKDIIVDSKGQWNHPGEVTRIPSNQITMQGVNYPVWAQPNVGPGMMMQPGQDYNFPNAQYVDEFPQMQQGGFVEKELDEQEIAELRAQGYTVEEYTEPLAKAQDGIEKGTETKAKVLKRDGLTEEEWAWESAPAEPKKKPLTAEQKKKQAAFDNQSKLTVPEEWANLELSKPVIKIPANMREARQMMDNGELVYETYEQRRQRDIREAQERKEAREKSLSDYDNRTQRSDYSALGALPGETWRETFNKEAESLDAKFRVSQEDNFFDDYINPAVWIGSMAKSLGQAPQLAEETDSYMPYVTSIGAPLLGGTLASLGTKTTGQFINNLANPFAGSRLVENIGRQSEDLAGKVVSSLYNSSKNFGKNIKNTAKTYTNKYRDDLKREFSQNWDDMNSVGKEQYLLHDEVEDLLIQKESLERRLISNIEASKNRTARESFKKNGIWPEDSILAIETELRVLNNKLRDYENGSISFADNSVVYKTPAVYEEAGSMKTKLDGDNTIIDFRTGAKIPINIKAPNTVGKISKVDNKITTSTESIDNYSFDPLYASTQESNIKFVQEKLPGSKPFGSSVFHRIGVAHASNDIDVTMTAADWAKSEKNVNVTGGRAKYGPVVNLGDEFGEAGKIDVNIIEEDLTTGLAKGGYAKELFKQLFPEEFYKAQQVVLQRKLKNPNISGDDLEITITKTPQELMDHYDPEVKSIFDAYEANNVSREKGWMPTKDKQINRIDYILETGTDFKKIKQAQESFIKSTAGVKANVGYQFDTKDLSNVAENIKALNKIGINGTHGYNVEKIATEPERMQLFLNDYYINKAVYTREVKLNEDYMKDFDDLTSSFQDWKSVGASANGYGTNSTALGFPDHVNDPLGVTGNTFYDLSKNKNYKNPVDYIDDIDKQTSGQRILSSDELTITNTIAKKYDVDFEIPNGKNPVAYEIINTANFGRNRGFLKGPEEIAKINNFYKELGRELGIKAISNGSTYGNSTYSTILNNIDKDIDDLALSFNKDIPTYKSRLQRHENLAKHNSKKPSFISEFHRLDEAYHKNKYYLEGSAKALKDKIKNVEDQLSNYNNSISDKAARFGDKKYSKKISEKTEMRDEMTAELKRLQAVAKDLEKKLDKHYKNKNKLQNVGLALGATSAFGILGSAIVHTNARYNKDEKKYYRTLRSKVLKDKDPYYQKIREALGKDKVKAYQEELDNHEGADSSIDEFIYNMGEDVYDDKRKYQFQLGGSTDYWEDDLTDDEIKQLKSQGYVVEELEEFQDGGNINPIVGDLISKVLMERNRDKEFVKRAFNPEEYPNHIQQNEDGTTSTHIMAWGEDDTGQAYMYPTIFNEANEAIKVPNQYADYISSVGYKRATGMNKKQTGGEKKEMTRAEALQIMRDQGGYSMKDLKGVATEDEMRTMMLGSHSQLKVSSKSTTKAPESKTQSFKPLPKMMISEPWKQAITEVMSKEPERKPIITSEDSEDSDYFMNIYNSALRSVSGGIDKVEDKVNDLIQQGERGWVKYGLGNAADDETYVDDAKTMLFTKAKALPSKNQNDKISEIENDNIPEIENRFQVNGSVKSDQSGDFWKYSNIFDGNKGFDYIAIPNIGNAKGKTYNNVKGVAHFILDSDVSGEESYKHSYAQSMIDKQLKGDSSKDMGSTVDDFYFPVYEKLGENKVNVKYLKKDEIKDKSKIMAPLRQYKFTDFDCEGSTTAEGFNSTVKSIPTKKAYVDPKKGTSSNQSNFIFPRDLGKGAYGKFGGNSVVFIAELPTGQREVLEMSGSIKEIVKTAKEFAKSLNISLDDLNIGYHDVGSFSDKPQAKNGILDTKLWSNWNDDQQTGAALAFPAD